MAFAVFVNSPSTAGSNTVHHFAMLSLLLRKGFPTSLSKMKQETSVVTPLAHSFTWMTAVAAQKPQPLMALDPT